MYIDILIIIINFPYFTCIRSFLAAASLLLCSFLNVFSVFRVYGLYDSYPYYSPGPTAIVSYLLTFVYM